MKFLMITAHGTMDTAVQALRYGASDFLTKPFENEEIRNIARRSAQERGRGGREATGRLAVTPSEPRSVLEGVVGKSPAFVACLEKARKAAAADTTVLLCGESGTGKEVLARAIHDLSAPRDKPFVAVNCGAIPENLLESELFGHEKGAFTGAIAAKPGKFALADGGTIFLDEIGEMPLLMQVKLLRVIQERTVEPRGLGPQPEGGRPPHRRHQPQPAGGDQGGPFPRGPLLPPQRHPHRPAAPARAGRRRAPPGRATSSRTSTAATAAASPSRPRTSASLLAHSLARQRPRAGQCHRAGRGAGVRAHPGLRLRDGTRPSGAGKGLRRSRQGRRMALKEKKQAVEREAILKALEANRWNKTQTAEVAGHQPAIPALQDQGIRHRLKRPSL